MLAEIDRNAVAGKSFAFETTLSGHGYLLRIRRWRLTGFIIKLVFLSLRTPEEAIERVAVRVRQGGHHVPSEIIRRRFTAGINNFRDVYRHEVDYWQLFDNSGSIPRLLEQGANR